MHIIFLYKIENKRHLLKIEVNKPLQSITSFSYSYKKILHISLDINDSNVHAIGNYK